MSTILIIGLIILVLVCLSLSLSAGGAGYYFFFMNNEGETLQSDSSSSSQTNSPYDTQPAQPAQPGQPGQPTQPAQPTQPQPSNGGSSTQPTPPAEEKCGYDNKPVLDITQGDLTQLIGLTNSRNLTYENAPFDYIEIKNFNVKSHTVDVTTDGKNFECKTFEADDPKKLIVKKAFNDEDYTYTFENGAIYIENESGKHKTQRHR